METNQIGLIPSFIDGARRLGRAYWRSVMDNKEAVDVSPPLQETLGGPTEAGLDLYQALVDLALGVEMILPHDLLMIRALAQGVAENGEPRGRDMAVLNYHARLVSAAEANDRRLEAAW